MQMQTTILSSQGQTTIPVDVRQDLGIVPGTILHWMVEKDGLGLKKILVSVPSIEGVKELKGIAKKLYHRYGGGARYLAEERNTWDQK